MSGDTILSCQRYVREIKEEFERLKDPKYAKASEKINPILEKYRKEKNTIEHYSIGYILATNIIGAIAGYVIYSYNLQPYEITTIAGFTAVSVGGLAGIAYSNMKKISKLKKETKKEIAKTVDKFRLKYTIDDFIL